MTEPRLTNKCFSARCTNDALENGVLCQEHYDALPAPMRGEQAPSNEQLADEALAKGDTEAGELSYDKPHPRDYGGEIVFSANGPRWSIPDANERGRYYLHLYQYWRWRAVSAHEPQPSASSTQLASELRAADAETILGTNLLDRVVAALEHDLSKALANHSADLSAAHEPDPALSKVLHRLEPGAVPMLPHATDVWRIGGVDFVMYEDVQKLLAERAAQPPVLDLKAISDARLDWSMACECTCSACTTFDQAIRSALTKGEG